MCNNNAGLSNVNSSKQFSGRREICVHHRLPLEKTFIYLKMPFHVQAHSARLCVLSKAIVHAIKGKGSIMRTRKVTSPKAEAHPMSKISIKVHT